VGFALYVSVHKWQLIQGEFRALQNYVGAVDNLIYIGLFFMALGAIFVSIRTLRGIHAEIQETGYDTRLWLLAIPGFFQAGAIASFFGWAYVQLPEFLNIANALRTLDRSREVYLYLLDQAFRAAPVVPAWNRFTIFTLLSIAAGAIAIYLWRNPDNPVFQFRLSTAWLGLALGPALLQVVFNAIVAEYDAAVETGTDPGIWPQFIMITSGVILLILAWRLWRGAENAESNLVLILRFFASITLMVGAVLLIIQIPTIVASGDPDLWKGLKVTVYFSVGTVPIQLAIALFLSVLLFQKLKGSELFRILYFIPYVTPAVASAAVFKQLFSNRSSAPANSLLKALGYEPQLWLREPDGVLEMIGNSMGLAVPAWAAGPSLALSVIILHSIWTFVGYNTVIYLAGLGNISTELLEAAEIDGANKWRVFRHITFPLLSPTTYFLSLIAVIGTFKAFNTIWILRDGAALGTTDPFSVVIFTEFFTKTRYGYAAALAFVLFAIILSLTVINNKIQGSRVFYG
jgi:multiple sugar transport system permease protein